MQLSRTALPGSNHRGICRGLWLLAASACLQPYMAHAVTPNSPEVKAVIKKGMEYLATAKDDRLGGKCLIALAFLKDGNDETHPAIVEAVTACKQATQAAPEAIQQDVYSTGMGIIFLCNLDPSKYSGEINKLLKSLELRQKPHGGWGYPEKPTGDTSMTQYGVLSMWEVSKVGFGTSLDSLERVANWLLRTQDPGGNWGYQGVEGESSKLVKQDSARNGMTAAGLGSTYICADLLKIGQATVEHDPNLPPALRLVKKAEKNKPISDAVEARSLRAAQDRGNKWMRKNYKIDPDGFTHYYLYALERYQSFLELSDGKQIKEPRWYNDGYAYLKKTQAKDGSWKSAQSGGQGVDTAFGILFLLRSTKKSIERSKSYGGGSLMAGRGLPRDPRDVQLHAGRIVARLQATTAEQMLAALADPESADFGSLATDEAPLVAAVSAAPAEDKARHIEQLRRLASSGSADARLVAVRALCGLRDFDSLPAVIDGLDDPDWRVVAAANRGLQFVSRELTGQKLDEQPNREQQKSATRHWKAWYLAVRPDATFDSAD